VLFRSQQQIMQSIPNKLAKPLCYVSDYLGINPILTHAAVDLYNWYLFDPNEPFDLDNLRSKNLITGTEDEERFYLVMVAIEKIGGQVIKELLHMQCINDDTTINKLDKIIMIESQLVIINESILKMISVIKRIREKCKPDVFYNVLRPFLSGWENNEKIPDGMLYEGVYEERKFYCGGSAAQSSLFQILDAAFGITHSDKYFEKIRNYMPKTHRTFIDFVKQNIDVKKIISDNDSHENNTTLFQRCVTNLMTFRSCHMRIVREYILNQIPSKKTDEIATDSVKGTGGTALVTFLNDSIKDTQKAIHQ
jgi:indoleamine 2,3-dioxygenase